MESQSSISIQLQDWSGTIISVEANPGQARHDYLQRLLDQAHEQGAATWLLSCNLEQEGPWAGLREFLQSLVPQLQASAPDLVTKHDYELATILPDLRRTLAIRNPSLTDTSPAEEKVRNYPADRALRIVHGLIDLLAAWHQRSGNQSWIIACDDYDRSGSLVRYFFHELIRRRGKQLQLTLIVATNLDASAATLMPVAAQYRGPTQQLDLPADAQFLADTQVLAQRAQELQQLVEADHIAAEYYITPLIYCYLHSDQPEQALKYHRRAFATYTTQALYQDALVYGEAARVLQMRYAPDNIVGLWSIAARLYFCYIAVGRAEEGLATVEAFMSQTHDPDYLLHCYYFMGMLYARYLPQRNLARAEDYLEQGLVAIEQSSLPEHEKLFQTVFNRNGLALVRHFQGRYDDAIALCEWGYAQLDAHLAPDQHRLHRSVLLYNIAQVYVASKQYPQAIEHFVEAMRLDPNYSEYYNERGNIFLKLGQLEEALSDYKQAIDLSPPYPEVWTNKGQCYRMLGQPQQAIDAYSIALDLNPQLVLPFTGRAEAFESLDQLEAALSDYTAALALKPEQPAVLTSRAIVQYSLGHIEAAAADLDAAIILAPQEAELYQNRALALADLGRLDDAARDLMHYLSLRPDAEDRIDVKQQIAKLQSGMMVS